MINGNLIILLRTLNAKTPPKTEKTITGRNSRLNKFTLTIPYDRGRIAQNDIRPFTDRHSRDILVLCNIREGLCRI